MADMRFVIKLLVSICVIVLCTQIGRRLPTLAGLIAVMPLTGLIVLIWLCLDNPGNFNVMTDYSKGALWGIVPSILFFLSVGHRAQHFIFPRGSCMLSETIAPLACTLCRFCGLARRGNYPSVAAQQIVGQPGYRVSSRFTYA